MNDWHGVVHLVVAMRTTCWASPLVQRRVETHVAELCPRSTNPTHLKVQRLNKDQSQDTAILWLFAIQAFVIIGNQTGVKHFLSPVLPISIFTLAFFLNYPLAWLFPVMKPFCISKR